VLSAEENPRATPEDLVEAVFAPRLSVLDFYLEHAVDDVHRASICGERYLAQMAGYATERGLKDDLERRGFRYLRGSKAGITVRTNDSRTYAYQYALSYWAGVRFARTGRKVLAIKSSRDRGSDHWRVKQLISEYFSQGFNDEKPDGSAVLLFERTPGDEGPGVVLIAVDTSKLGLDALESAEKLAEQLCHSHRLLAELGDAT